MSSTTYLQMATSEEIAALAQNPAGIDNLDKPHDASLAINVPRAINFFWLGSPSPSSGEHGPGAAALGGFERMATNSLGTGGFGLVQPERTSQVAQALAGADLSSLHDVVQYGDLGALVAEEELYDLEPFIQDDDVAEFVVEELEALVDFYRRAAQQGMGVVIFSP